VDVQAIAAKHLYTRGVAEPTLATQESQAEHRQCHVIIDLGEHGVLKHLAERVVERALEAELTAHRGRPARQDWSEGNYRNGKGKQTVHMETGQFDLIVPRDRQGSFAPQLVKKRQRCPEGFDDQVLSLSARGLSTREMHAHLEELDGVGVSPTLISHITEAVLDEAAPGSRAPSPRSSRSCTSRPCMSNRARGARPDQGGLSGPGHHPGGREETPRVVAQQE
jgi:hypothetical protein